MILTEFAPLTPDMASSMLSWMYCEKLKVDAGQRVGELLLQLLGQLLFGQPARPILEWLQRHKQLDIGERRGIAAVVRPAVLGYAVTTSGWRSRISRILRVPPVAGIEPNARRHRRADPQIALLEVRAGTRCPVA